MLAAAKFAVAVNEAVRSVPGRTVATVGRMTVTPNTTNVIPGQVVLTVDLRDLDAAKVEHFTQRFEQLGKEIGAATGTTFAFTRTVDSAAGDLRSAGDDLDRRRGGVARVSRVSECRAVRGTTRRRSRTSRRWR